MQLLSNEVWCQIFSFLPPKEKRNAKLACKLWHDLIINDTQHLIFNLVHRYHEFHDDFEWNYKRILNIVTARPKLTFCHFESYMKCQYFGDGFATFFKQAKLLNVDQIFLDRDLSHFCSEFLPGWITVQKLWLQDSLEVDEKNIQALVAYVPGCRREQSYLSISDKFMQELEEILPKLKHLQELDINFEACDVPFTLISLFQFFDSLPIKHLKEVEFKKGQLLDVTEEEFEEFVISALKKKLWPDCELSLKDFEFKSDE